MVVDLNSVFTPYTTPHRHVPTPFPPRLPSEGDLHVASALCKLYIRVPNNELAHSRPLPDVEELIHWFDPVGMPGQALGFGRPGHTACPWTAAALAKISWPTSRYTCP